MLITGISIVSVSNSKKQKDNYGIKRYLFYDIYIYFCSGTENESGQFLWTLYFLINVNIRDRRDLCNLNYTINKIMLHVVSYRYIFTSLLLILFIASEKAIKSL